MTEGEIVVTDEFSGAWRVAVGWDRRDEVVREEPPAQVFGRAEGVEFELPRTFSEAAVDELLDSLFRPPRRLEEIVRALEVAGHRVRRVWRRRGLPVGPEG